MSNSTSESLAKLRALQAKGEGNDATELITTWRSDTLEELDKMLNSEGFSLLRLSKVEDPDAMYKELVFFELYKEGDDRRAKHVAAIKKLIEE